MLGWAIALTILGWAVTVLGVVLLLITTPKEIAAIGNDRDAILERADDDIASERERLGVDTAEFAAYAEMRNAQARSELEAAHIPSPSGTLFDGPSHTTMTWTLERVARANVPNVIVALAGGTISMVASLLSLSV